MFFAMSGPLSHMEKKIGAGTAGPHGHPAYGLLKKLKTSLWTVTEVGDQVPDRNAVTSGRPPGRWPGSLYIIVEEIGFWSKTSKIFLPEKDRTGWARTSTLSRFPR